MILPLSPSSDESYKMVTREGTIVEQRRGVLSIAGSDSIEFLQRMSTNDMTDVKSTERTCTTLLTSEKARIIDLVAVLNTGDALLMLTSADMQQRVKEWLEKFIIMEDIQIIDVTSNYSTHSIIGVNALRSLRMDSHAIIEQESTTVLLKDPSSGNYLFRDHVWHTPVFTLVSKRDHAPDLFSTTIPDNPDIVETLRIEDGVPLTGKELTENVNPLEAGLNRFISFGKGCFIGQEVIARLDTYNKLQKVLVGIIFETVDELLLTTGKLFQTSDEIGYTTSHTWSPKLQRYIALGYVKNNCISDRVEFRSTLISKSMAARIVHIPFA